MGVASPYILFSEEKLNSFSNFRKHILDFENTFSLSKKWVSFLEAIPISGCCLR